MYHPQQLYRCGLGEHWRRQIGDVSPTAFARQIGGCEDLIHRLVNYAELEGHNGCVNTVSFNPTGELLVSGSDDQQIKLWNWASKSEVLSYDSGHVYNVFQARVMPYSDDRIIITCAADGQVRYGTILENGDVSTKSLAKHRNRAHKMAIEPGSSRIFYSCGEDGVVRHFDLREEKSTKLLTCHQFRTSTGKPSRTKVVRLNAIVMNPRNLHYFAVGGSDQYARVYDIRRITASGLEMEDQPVECYAPKHLQGPGHEEHITCVAYSHQEELLVSYNDELIYLFDKSMSLGSGPGARSTEDDENEEDEGEGSHQETTKPQVYEGHRNHQTVKGVNFFGPSTEYVVSGSDCGRIFIWKKTGGELVALMRGDNKIVNCLEPHPHATILATSGIDDTVKVWAPLSDRILPLPQDADKCLAIVGHNMTELVLSSAIHYHAVITTVVDILTNVPLVFDIEVQVMKMNKRRRESHATSIPLTAGLVRTLLLQRHLQIPTDNIEGGTYTRVSFEGGSLDEEVEAVLNSDFEGDDDDSSEDGGTGNPRECIVS